MPFDVAIFDEVISRLKRRTPSPPGSVRAGALRTHEILGGEGDQKPIFGRGYFLVWARGLADPGVPVIQQQGTPNRPVANPPTVTVRDANNQPIAGFPLRFTVAVGGGFLDGNDNLKVLDLETNAEGIARVASWTLGPNPGPNEVVVEGFGVTRTFQVNAVLPAANVEQPESQRKSKTDSPGRS